MIQSWVILGLVAAVGAAGVTLFSKLGLEGMDPTLATTLRSTIMTAVLIAVTLSTGRQAAIWSPEGPDLRSWTFIGLAGASGAVSWLAYFAALRLGATADVAVLDRLSLVLIIVLGALFLGESYGWRAWIGVLLIVAGAVLVTLGARTRPPTASGHTEMAPAEPSSPPTL